MKSKSPGRVCCVPNCPNTEIKNRDLKFYSFPNREWETIRRKLWISRVQRAGNKNGPWAPTKNIRICSAHFIGGVKSNDPRKENYNPTIFPWTLAKKSLQTPKQILVEPNENRNLNSSHVKEEPVEPACSTMEVKHSQQTSPENNEIRELTVPTDESVNGKLQDQIKEPGCSVYPVTLIAVRRRN